MRYPYIILISLIFLLSSCAQMKDKEGNHPVQNISEAASIEPPPSTPAPVDDAVIIGGYRTEYRLSRANSRTNIFIRIAKTECADLTGIEQFVHLESLRLYLRETSDIDFSPLKSLPKLKHIYIHGSALTELPDLGGIPSLTALELSTNSLTSLNGLEKVPQLEYLEITETCVPVTDMSALRYLTKLRELIIWGGSYNIDFNALKDLPELEGIFLTDCGELDLSGAGQLKQLKRLLLEIRVSRETGNQSVFKNIEEIGGMTGLQYLTIDEVITSVEFIAANINLEQLVLIAGMDRYHLGYYGNPFIPLDVAPLGNLKKLKYLAIRGFELKNAHVLDSLPEVHGYETNLYPEH